MADLMRHRWLQCGVRSPISHPLKTPGVLSAPGSAVADQINTTMDAFHLATRNGFRLQEVATAPLARRRKEKKTSVDTRSSSTDSTNSGSTCSTTSSCGASQAPAGQSPAQPLSRNSSASSISQSSVCSMGFIPSHGGGHNSSSNSSNNPSPTPNLASKLQPSEKQHLPQPQPKPYVIPSTFFGPGATSNIGKSPLCIDSSIQTPAQVPVIHIPSRDSWEGSSVEDIDNLNDYDSPPVKKTKTKEGVIKKRGKNKNEQSSSVLRLTRGRKRKLEEEGIEECDGSLEDRNDEDCVIVEKNYPDIPTTRGRHLQSETIVIDD